MTEVKSDFLRSLGPTYFTGPVFLGAALDQTGVLSFLNQSSVFTTSFQAGTALATVEYVLPTAGPAANDYLLASTTAGVLSWFNAGGTFAPIGAAYVTIGNTASLTAERALTGTANQITVTDNGVNSTAVLSLPQNIDTAATPTFSSLTLGGASGNTLVVDTSTLVADASNDLVGIGTASPSSYNSNARKLVVRNSGGNAGMALSSNSNASCFMAFQDTESTTIPGLLSYSHNATATSETLAIRVGGVDDILVITGASVSTFSGQLIGKGTATNDSAAAGFIGQILSASAVRSAPVALTTTVTANVTSVSLTAGDWDVFGQIGFTGGGTTTIISYGIATTSATLPATDTTSVPTTNQVRGGLPVSIAASDATDHLYCRVSLASTTTIYLVANATFAVGSTSAFGSIFARRSR